MATLASINNTLMRTEQTVVSSDEKLGALAQMWADYTSEYRDRFDDEERRRLEAEREGSNKATKATKDDNDDKAKEGSGLFGGGLGETVARIAGFMGKLLTGGVLAALVGLFSKKLIEQIGLDPDGAIGNAAAAFLFGGAAGYAIGGRKGALIGGIVAAGLVLSEKLGSYMSKKAEEYDIDGDIGEEIGTGLGRVGTAAAIGASIGGPKGALLFAVGAVVAEGARLTYKYFTDPEFAAKVDEGLIKIGEHLKSAFETIANKVANYLNESPLFDAFIDTEEEKAQAAAIATESEKAIIKQGQEAQAELEARGAVASQVNANKLSGAELRKLASQYNVNTGDLTDDQLISQAAGARNVRRQIELAIKRDMAKDPLQDVAQKGADTEKRLIRVVERQGDISNQSTSELEKKINNLQLELAQANDSSSFDEMGGGAPMGEKTRQTKEEELRVLREELDRREKNNGATNVTVGGSTTNNNNITSEHRGQIPAYAAVNTARPVGSD